MQNTLKFTNNPLYSIAINSRDPNYLDLGPFILHIDPWLGLPPAHARPPPPATAPARRDRPLSLRWDRLHSKEKHLDRKREKRRFHPLSERLPVAVALCRRRLREKGSGYPAAGEGRQAAAACGLQPRRVAVHVAPRKGSGQHGRCS
jgi:hypothetical protein